MALSWQNFIVTFMEWIYKCSETRSGRLPAGLLQMHSSSPGWGRLESKGDSTTSTSTSCKTSIENKAWVSLILSVLQQVFVIKACVTTWTVSQTDVTPEFDHRYDGQGKSEWVKGKRTGGGLYSGIQRDALLTRLHTMRVRRMRSNQTAVIFTWIIICTVDVCTCMYMQY